MRKSFKAAVSAVASAAMVASLLAMPISAYAASGITNSVSSSTSWTTPTEYMTNTVDVDVDNDGDTETAKVITTWANAWALSGPDYLGVSNSGTLNQNGGAASSSNYTTMKSSELFGIWASSVNEVPNAYNWNYFYNCYLTYIEKETDDTLAAIDVSNGSDAGFSSRAGVWACFVYRPEVIWCSNSLSSDQTYTYTELIRAGQYYTAGNVTVSVAEEGTYAALEEETVFDSAYTYYYIGVTSDARGNSSYSWKEADVTTFDDSTTYYTYDSDNGYSEASITEFTAGTTYYTKDAASYTEVGASDSFDSAKTYYTYDSNNGYSEADITEFAAGTTYYTKDADSYTELLTDSGSDTNYYYKSSDTGMTIFDSDCEIISVGATESSTTSNNSYYISGDEDYDPYVVSGGAGALGTSTSLTGTSATPGSGGVWCELDALYDLAGYCEEIIDTYDEYNSSDTVTSTNVTWQTMNSLPRTTRYEASSEDAVSAREACLNLEKVMRGAFWYTKAATDSTSSYYDSSLGGQKTVAVVSGSLDTTASTVTLGTSDSVPGMTNSSDSGKFNACFLVTEQPTDSNGDYITSASADELLACDVIWAANGSTSVSDWQSWLSSNATTEELKAKASTISIITDVPALMNGHNWTVEKTVCVLYSLNFIYPELFPELELVTYWYDCVYHVKSNYLTTALAYGLGACTLPSDVSSLADLPGSSYSTIDIDNKAYQGYQYYKNNSYTSTECPNDELTPSSDMETWASSYSVQEVTTTTTTATTADVTVSVSSGTVSVSGTDASAYVAAITKVYATDSDGNDTVLTFNEDGTLDTSTLAEGTYTLTIVATGYETVTSSLTVDSSGTVTSATVTSGTTATTTTTGGSGSGNTVTGSAFSVKAKSASAKGKYKKKKLKKPVTVKAKSLYTISGKATKFAIAKKVKGVKVNAKSGNITLGKGLKKKTYKVKVKITGTGTDGASKTVTVTVKIKLK